ncbi:Transferase-like protein 2 [Elsinoe fawcettii]|nr:Transferase-like protein 2 [Elsinoe fawcettii]
MGVRAETVDVSNHTNTTSDDASIIPLSAFDNIMPRIYAHILYILEVKDDERVSDIHHDLETALQRTCYDMPFLAGQVRIRSEADQTSHGRLELVIPRKADPTESVSIKFKDLRKHLNLEDLLEAGIPDDELDGNLLLPTGMFADLEAGAPVIVSQANYLRGGCILSVGIHHAVSDGNGMFTAMQKWTRHLQDLSNSVVSPAVKKVGYQAADRNALHAAWTYAGHQHDPYAYKRASEQLWRFLGVNNISSPTEDIKQAEAPIPDEKMSTGIFFVTSEALSSMRMNASKGKDGSIAHSLTANDALMALLWQATMRARFQMDQVDSDVDAVLDSTVDGRGMFSTDLPANYVGNVVVMNTTTVALKELVAPDTPLSVPARAVRDSLAAMTRKRIHEAYTLADSLPDYTGLTFPFATFAGSELCITSVINIGSFSLDFGSHFGNGGKCVSVRLPRSEFAAICRRCVALPRRESGGFEVLISMFESEMDRLLADKSFTQYASLCSI